ncbi:a61d65a9-8921-4bbe-8aac-fc07d12802e0-CDS [Sclerotinia trifoliorum]|uniref:A61d65a9-8921-4bbe-8aac-fc07d12802e0-CDS n=1 Tax=Sclerotinia trifoliorum TaxID=28548 RepID=A0A8H2ZS39_9HELO|nr:a61d65a9-8921-4bbe-8aac-fc07d12802e0-CDS [Sclerotinia trifoliorum]
MNSLWPAARSSCLQTRTTLQTCKTIDSLVSRLAYGTVRPYSKSSIPFRQRELGSRKIEGENNGWTGNLGLQCSKRFYASKRKAPKIPRSSTLSNELPPKSASLKAAGPKVAPGKTIYTKYGQLPADYEDQMGLDYRQDPITEEENQAIFGHVMDGDSAERFLRVIHGRRVAGTLPDPDEPSSLAYWEEVAQKSALAWLRKNIPVDEDENAALRAEQELAEIEGGIVEDPKKIGIYVPNVGGLTRGGKINVNLYKSKDSKERAQETKSVYGDSGLDAIRKANEAKFAAQERKRQEELSQADEAPQNTGTLDHVKPRSRVELRRKGENPWLKYYEKKAQETAPEVVPELSAFTRLWPSTLALLLTIGVSCTLAHFYIPPQRAARMFPEIPPAVATISALFVANAVVLFLWRVPPAWQLLNKYFIIIPAYPRGLSMIGSVFSHQAFSHFIPNMVLLAIFGVQLHDEIGRANFLALYFSMGAISSFASLAWWVWKRAFISSTLGASGAVCGVMAAFLWNQRDNGVSIFGVIPKVPSWLVLGLLFGLEIFSWRRVSRLGGKQIRDHQAHLSGYTAGVAGVEVMRWRERVRKRQAEERSRNIEGLMKREVEL